MSSGSPDPRWAPGAPPTPQELLAKGSFRLRHSLWLLGPIVGFGFVTWASFLYIGAKARRWDWLVAGCVYAALVAVCFYFNEPSGTPAAEQNDWVGGLIIMTWFAGIVHALLSNKAWLRWRSEHSVPWYAAGATTRPGAPVHPSHPAPLPPQLAGTGLDAQYYAAPPAPPSRPAPGSVPAPGLAATRPSGPPPGPLQPGPPQRAPLDEPAPNRALDVNSATVPELAGLPGLDMQRAQHAVAERQARGGFSSVAEFADAAGLAPHEHSRLRPLVVCSPPPRGPAQPGYGRVVDY